MFIYSPWNLYGLLTSIHALLLVYWPSHGIAIDHSSIGLKRLTIQLVFNEAWLCVLARFSRHNTSQVCTATLRCPRVLTNQKGHYICIFINCSNIHLLHTTQWMVCWKILFSQYWRGVHNTKSFHQHQIFIWTKQWEMENVCNLTSAIYQDRI